MKRENFLWLCLGLIIGLGAVIASPKSPSNNKCATYKVSEEVATSYVLKPVVIKEKCEPIIQEQKACENVSQEEKTNVVETKPEKHRRHRRYRRYWK